ncbi:MAG: zinc-ribbon domain-containing protein [Candidatus Heimdallarchaeota archaeon]|nr:zinc-ribbon domain-containing protein [Candidatus Heimdallarchaeota archaeon]MBY8994468.1 zinc-ribbon domain-containing protein [Candidatus Heimdallarchaeota archaeon]
MKKVHCVYCGEKIDSDAKFCNNCGSSVPVREASKKVTQRETRDSYTNAIEETYEETMVIRRPRTRNLRKIIIGLVVITGVLAVVLPATLIPLYNSYSYHYLGSTTYTSDSIMTNNASLIIDNVSGDIDISYDLTQTEVLTAVIQVYGRSEANFSEAKTITEDFPAGLCEFIFNSDEETQIPWKERMIYDLDIIINPTVAMKFNIIVSSGDVYLDSNSVSSAIIEKLDIVTFSGDIVVDLGTGKTITSQTVNIEASSGNIYFSAGSNCEITTPLFKIFTFSGDIDLSFDNGCTINSSIIDLETSSGSIDIDFGLNTQIYGNSLDVETFSGDIVLEFGHSTNITLVEFNFIASSGNIMIYCDQVDFNNDFKWDINSFSGDVYLNIEPNSLTGVNYTAEFTIQVSSGNIDIDCSWSESNIGLKVSAEVSSGEIYLPNGYDNYESIGYNLKEIKYDLDLVTFSGDIRVSTD